MSKDQNTPTRCAACGEYMPPHAPHMCANWPLTQSSLIERMKQIAPGFYTERDGGPWYCLTPEHDRIAEDFRNRDDARRLILWLAGAELPDGWTITPHGNGELSYDLKIPGQYAEATVWARYCRKLFPDRAAELAVRS